MDQNQIKFDIWKQKNEEKMNEFVNTRFKENIESIKENWAEIEKLTKLRNLEQETTPKLREHTSTMIEKILHETQYIDENLTLITTHFRYLN